MLNTFSTVFFFKNLLSINISNIRSQNNYTPYRSLVEHLFKALLKSNSANHYAVLEKRYNTSVTQTLISSSIHGWYYTAGLWCVVKWLNGCGMVVMYCSLSFNVHGTLFRKAFQKSISVMSLHQLSVLCVVGVLELYCKVPLQFQKTNVLFRLRVVL